MTERTPDERTGDARSPSTICPLCAVGCHLERGDREADGSRARGVSGPANPEGRLCRKGISAFDIVDDDDRLTRPLIRQDGDHVPVSWATAYERVVESFEAVVDAHGPDALAFLGAPHCTNEENYLLQKLARTLGTNNVDNRARLCHVSTARTLSERVGWPATTNGLDDLADADVILVAGANPAERQPVAFDSFVRPAVNNGTTLVHIDPAGNRTTRLADVHLAPRPGADALVFDLLSVRILESGGVDREFVARRTQGYEAFATELGDFDCEAAARVAGVESDSVGRVADRIGSADRVAALVGTGIEGEGGDGENEANASGALLNLLLLTGNLGRRGTGLHVLRGLVNEQGATDAGCVPDRLPGHQPVTDSEARARIAAEWGVSPPSKPGATATELLASFGDEVRGALVVGENPAISKRETEWLRRRFDALDALVVVDIASTETTPHADVVLPAAAGVEKAGTVTNLDRRVQRLRPTASPPGEAWPDFDILRELGRRLAGAGLVEEGQFEYSRVAEAFDELTRVAPTHAGVSYSDFGCEDSELGDGGSELGKGRRWPFDNDAVLYRETFETADGRAAFGSVQPTVESKSEAESGLRLITGGRTSDVLGDRRATNRELRMHPDDADERGIESGDSVVVSSEDTAVEAMAESDEEVRQGTVYLHAAVADPLLRRGASAVAVELASRTGDGEGGG